MLRPANTPSNRLSLIVPLSSRSFSIASSRALVTQTSWMRKFCEFHETRMASHVFEMRQSSMVAFGESSILTPAELP